jgi:Zn-dependent protease
MPGWLAAILVLVNLGLIYFLMAAPLGLRTIRLRTFVPSSRDRIWQALWPLGRDANWSGDFVGVEQLPDGQVAMALTWDGRDGRPIMRVAQHENVVEGERFTSRIVEDSSLDAAFWANHVETVELAAADGGVVVTVEQTDRYRGFAFLAFRYFALRRKLMKLRIWAATGVYKPGGLFERPSTQVLMALISIAILWSLTGFSVGGLAFATILTVVVALHELGHMAAFRISGHRKVRMIFVPLLGGIAVGGRPYDSHFEVAFVALMGAGFSAFLVPPLLLAGHAAVASGNIHGGNFVAALVGCIALFNLANLTPVWKFDGGQVLRQIVPRGLPLALSSFALLALFLGVGLLAGFHERIVLVSGAALAALSLITAGSNVKPRHALLPIDRTGRAVIAAGLIAVMVIHASGVVWAFRHFA